MLVNARDIVMPAKKNGYGILAACPMNADEIGWAIEAADESNSPVILCKNLGMVRKGSEGLKEFADAVKYYCTKHPRVPVAMCLDHGFVLETCMDAIQNGFTLLMMDRSMMSVEDNIKALQEFAPIAHALGCAIEAGLGGTEWRDPTPEEILEHMTKPDEFVKLVSETGVDSVAVFVGGSHGDKKDGTQVLHHDLIEELKNSTDAWLAMHGSSFVGDEKLGAAARAGISKFNVAGDLEAGGVRGFTKAIKENKKGLKNAMNCSLAIREGYKQRCKDFYEVFGSKDKIGGCC